MTDEVISSVPSGRRLVSAIQSGDISNSELRRLPAQHLYMAIQAAGLESVVDILSLIQSEQYQLLLDFELWSRDSFQEEHFFDWLLTIDEQDSFEPLEKLLTSMDIEILSLLIARQVETVVYEEPTDLPPGPQWYTPDGGSTWVLIKVENPRQHRVFGKLLAYLFQRSAETFYQLVLSSGDQTPTEIEENCYQTQRRRLSGIGIPDHEVGWQIHTPLAESVAAQRILSELESRGTEIELPDLNVQLKSSGLQPLQQFIDTLSVRADAANEIEAETAKLLNAAVVFFGIDVR